MSGAFTNHSKALLFHCDYFDEFFSGIKQNQGLGPLIFHMILIARRLSFVAFAIHYTKQAWLQAISLIIVSDLTWKYLWLVKPFESPSQNWIEIANELFILVITYLVAVCVGWNLPLTHRVIVGLATVALIFAMITVNFIYWAIQFSKSIKYSFRVCMVHRSPCP